MTAAAPYLLRALLPDRPGALGALATAIGAAGGDIVSVEVVDREPTGALDDFVVRIEPGRLAELLAAASEVPGVRVETVRAYEGQVDLGHELDLVDTLTEAPALALALVARVGAQAFKASWAVVLDGSGDGVTCRHGTPGAPRLLWSSLPWMPLIGPMVLGADDPWVPSSWVGADTALAAAPVGSPTLVLLLGRSGGPSFRPAEVQRLGHLARMAATIAAAATGPPGPSAGRSPVSRSGAPSPS
jgi:hypothetical protein